MPSLKQRGVLPWVDRVKSAGEFKVGLPLLLPSNTVLVRIVLVVDLYPVYLSIVFDKKVIIE